MFFAHPAYVAVIVRSGRRRRWVRLGVVPIAAVVVGTAVVVVVMVVVVFGATAATAAAGASAVAVHDAIPAAGTFARVVGVAFVAGIR